MYDWSKELVVVTGGSEGIGAVVVRLLAERMIRVVVLDVQDLKYEGRSQVLMRRTSCGQACIRMVMLSETRYWSSFSRPCQTLCTANTSPAPQGVHHYTCDLASPLSISSTAAQIRAEHGDPTILINNAGLSRGKPILSASESDIRLTFNVNTLSHYLLAQAFLPAMVARNHGMIVTIASLAAYVTAPRFVDYSASKAAAVAFHEGLGAELATLYGAPKVRTVLVCQGYARTPLSAGLDEGDGWWMYALRPETVAEEIVKTVLGGRSRHVVLPASAWYAAAQLRGWPVWVQVGLRKTIARRTKGYRGRQVEQPSEGKIGGGLA